MTSYVVVGGGIVGASIAFHLGRRTDDPVVVYEQGDLASATTFRATAMVGTAGPAPYHRLKRYGIECYNDFFADPEAEPQYRQAGRLRVATTDEGVSALQDYAAAGADEGPFANSPAEYIPGDELRGRLVVPPLETEHVEGALHRPEFGYVLDDSRTLGARELALEFIERARDTGVRFEPNTEVTDVRTENGAVTGVEIEGSDVVAADHVVCAAGPWNRQVAAMAGLDLPLSHDYSPVFALGLPEPLSYTMPMVKAHESGVGLHPKADDTVLVTSRPDGGQACYDPDAVGDTAPEEHRDSALATAARLLPILEDAELVDEWVGLGTATPDGHPIVGRTPVPGLAVAATMSGIQYAPAVGCIVARQLVDDEPTRFHDAVALSRFDGYADPWADGDVR